MRWYRRCMTQLAIRLNDDDLEVLDAAAAAAGVTRSEAARRAIRALGERSGRPDPDAELRRIDALLGVPHRPWASAATVLRASPDPTLGDDLDAALGDELAPGDPWA